jgi:hypothetical protein
MFPREYTYDVVYSDVKVGMFLVSEIKLNTFYS